MGIYVEAKPQNSKDGELATRISSKYYQTLQMLQLQKSIEESRKTLQSQIADVELGVRLVPLGNRWWRLGKDAGRVEIFQDGEWQKLTPVLKDGQPTTGQSGESGLSYVGLPRDFVASQGLPGNKVHSLQVRVHVHRKGENHFRLRKERGKWQEDVLGCCFLQGIRRTLKILVLNYFSPSERQFRVHG